MVLSPSSADPTGRTTTRSARCTGVGVHPAAFGARGHHAHDLAGRCLPHLDQLAGDLPERPFAYSSRTPGRKGFGSKIVRTSPLGGFRPQPVDVLRETRGVALADPSSRTIFRSVSVDHPALVEHGRTLDREHLEDPGSHHPHTPRSRLHPEDVAGRQRCHLDGTAAIRAYGRRRRLAGSTGPRGVRTRGGHRSHRPRNPPR